MVVSRLCLHCFDLGNFFSHLCGKVCFCLPSSELCVVKRGSSSLILHLKCKTNLKSSSGFTSHKKNHAEAYKSLFYNTQNCFIGFSCHVFIRANSGTNGRFIGFVCFIFIFYIYWLCLFNELSSDILSSDHNTSQALTTLRCSQKHMLIN